jgi:ubiquinone/menaquinone biosynthesis C-methylase UbiE
MPANSPEEIRVRETSPPSRDPAMTRDLHEGFRDARRVPAGDLERFLGQADRLPGIRAVQRALRHALDVRPGMRLLDAGCGIGLETARLAAEHPDTSVTGVDRNRELLRIAQRRADPRPANLCWREADLAALELPDASFDAIRTERVLMYLPDDCFERVLDDLVRLLRPGGRLALFELDYGATILAPGSADDPVLRRVDEALRASLPQPLAGRRIPGLLAARDLSDVVATPFSFAVDEPVWRRIVSDTLTSGPPLDPAVSTWLDEQRAAAARGEFVAAFTGILTAASQPPQAASMPKARQQRALDPARVVRSEEGPARR